MRIVLLLILFFSFNATAQNWIPTSIADMPLAISNNAVCEAKVNGVDFMYSFGGIDTSKNYLGIKRSAFKYNIATNTWSGITELPDTLGKIASAASYLKDKIYIIGGYHVFSNGAEVSSSKVHIYDPTTDTYLPDGQDITTPIDDQAQAVYRDSLIYVISGWSNTGNVTAVQVYDPTNDIWFNASSVPNTNDYKSFGAQAVISGDSIFYYGGASMANDFPAQSQLRIGVIDANNPASINWLPTEDNITHPLYRMIGIANPDGNITFLGGSSISYNYNGLSYTDGLGVPPANKQVVYNLDMQSFTNNTSQSFPMDIRGYANTSATIKHICGGMQSNQVVSKQAFKLTFAQGLSQSEFATEIGLKVYPNPATEQLSITIAKTMKKPLAIKLINVEGQTLYTGLLKEGANNINVSEYPAGNYYLVLRDERQVSFAQVLVIMH